MELGLVTPDTAEVPEAAKELGITIIAWEPLASGLLTGKYHREPERLRQAGFARRMMLGRDLERARPVVEVLEEVAARHGATPAQVALNWVVSFQGEGVVAIPGASKARHAAENAAACVSSCLSPRKGRQVTGKPHGMPHQAVFRRVRPVHHR